MDKTLVSLMVLIMTALTPTSSAAENIEVVREVLLESGTATIPRSITRTPDGGYVITGKVYHDHAWAAKTDAEGKLAWRYELPVDGEPRPTVESADLTGAMSSRDGGTLLCGYTYVGERPAPRKVVGLLIKLDKEGHLVNEAKLYPNGDQEFPINYLRKCAPWGDGFAVVGEASRLVVKEGRRDLEYFYWLLALDTGGAIKWQKLIPNSLGNVNDFSPLLVLPNQDLVFSAWRFGMKNPTEIIRIDSGGQVKAKRQYSSGLMLVRSDVPDPVIRAVTLEKPEPNKPIPTLLNLGPDLANVGETPGQAMGNVVKRAYVLPDRSLVLFGSDIVSGDHTASIVKLSSDLHLRQAFQFQPLWRTYWIEDAVATGEPGEFATVRGVLPGRGETRSGVLLAFVRIH